MRPDQPKPNYPEDVALLQGVHHENAYRIVLASGTFVLETNHFLSSTELRRIIDSLNLVK